MSLSYRLVYFVPDPFVGTRLLVAALTQDDDGNMELVRATRLPDVNGAGGPRKLKLLHRILDGLCEEADLESAPHRVGSHVAMDDIRTLPDSIANPSEWLKQHLLPHGHDEQSDERIPPTPEAYQYVYGRWPRMRRWLVRRGLSVAYTALVMAAREFRRAAEVDAAPADTMRSAQDAMWEVATEILELLDNPWTLDYRYDPPRRVKHDDGDEA